MKCCNVAAMLLQVSVLGNLWRVRSRSCENLCS